MQKIFLIVALCALPRLAAAIDVFACEPEWAALVKEIGADHASVYSATTAQQDPHQVQARPSLLARFRSADLAVCTGAELEIGWLPNLQANGANPRLQPGKPGMFEAFRFVDMLEVPAKVDRAEGDVHPYGNPHIQTDPRNIGKVAGPLAQRLAEIDPSHADAYRQRAAAFAQRWSEALKRWEASAQPLRGMAVISHHKSWVYLYDWLGIREVATLEPKPGLPPSAAQLQSLLDVVKREPIKLIVRTAYEDDKPSDFLASRSGLPAVELPFTVGADGADDLFTLFDVTLERLRGALK